MHQSETSEAELHWEGEYYATLEELLPPAITGMRGTQSLHKQYFCTCRVVLILAPRPLSLSFICNHRALNLVTSPLRTPAQHDPHFALEQVTRVALFQIH